MTSLFGKLRRKLLGETRTIPLGVATALALALVLRALLPGSQWQTVGGFALAGLVVATLIRSLPLAHRPNPTTAVARTQQPPEHKE